MADIKPLKRDGGITKMFGVGDTLPNTLMPTKFTKGGDADGGDLSIGTNDNNNLTFRTNNTVRWTIDGTNGYLRRGGTTSDFGLHLFGVGAGSTIAFGDRFDATTPYVCVREHNGTDTDQIECYGQKGAGLRAGVFGTTTPQVWVTQQGRVGFNETTPTAKAHFAGCSAGTSNSSIKIGAGTLSTASDGAVDYDGTNYYACVGTTRYQVARVLTGSDTLDFPNTAAQSASELTMVVLGAAAGDDVIVSPPTISNILNGIYTARVSGAGIVSIKFSNFSAGALNPNSGLFKVTVFKNI